MWTSFVFLSLIFAVASPSPSAPFLQHGGEESSDNAAAAEFHDRIMVRGRQGMVGKRNFKGFRDVTADTYQNDESSSDAAVAEFHDRTIVHGGQDTVGKRNFKGFRDVTAHMFLEEASSLFGQNGDDDMDHSTATDQVIGEQYSNKYRDVTTHAFLEEASSPFGQSSDDITGAAAAAAFIHGRQVIHEQNSEHTFLEDVDFITPELYDQVRQHHHLINNNTHTHTHTLTKQYDFVPPEFVIPEPTPAISPENSFTIDPIIIDEFTPHSSNYSNSKKTLLPYIMDGTEPTLNKALSDFESLREESVDELMDRVVVSDEAVPVYVLHDSGNIRETYTEDDIDVTLVTQLSIDRVWLLEGLCSRWDGRVVAAIFVRSREDLDVVSMLHDILVEMFPVRIVAVSHLETTEQLPEKADETSESLSQYPINSMRNTAIEYSDTSHYLLLDVDMWPSLELRDKLLEALRETCPDCSSRRSAIVVPAFSIRDKFDRYDVLRHLTLEQAKNHTHTMPDSFESLAECSRRTAYVSLTNRFPDYLCGIFGGEINHYGHSSTRVFQWWKQSSPRKLSCIESDRYEPYVVLPRSEFKHLRYDTAFTGYGGNKIELIIRLRLMGFSFYVIDRGFVFHHPHPLSKSKVVWWSHPEYREQRKKILQNLISGIKSKLQESNMLESNPATPCCPQRIRGGHGMTAPHCFAYFQVRTPGHHFHSSSTRRSKKQKTKH